MTDPYSGLTRAKTHVLTEQEILRRKVLVNFEMAELLFEGGNFREAWRRLKRAILLWTLGCTSKAGINRAQQ